MSWNDPCMDCGNQRRDCECTTLGEPKLTSKDHFDKTVELLKEKGVTNVTRHFSPFDESGYYNEGSGTQVFHTESKTYMFIFDRFGRLISSTEI